MHEAGALSFSGTTSSSAADGESQGASEEELDQEGRSKLLRVLRICEGNIFGETNEDGMRRFYFLCLFGCSCFVSLRTVQGPADFVIYLI